MPPTGKAAAAIAAKTVAKKKEQQKERTVHAKLKKDLGHKLKPPTSESEDEQLFALDQPAITCTTCSQTSHTVDKHNPPGSKKLVKFTKTVATAEYENKLYGSQCYPCGDVMRSHLEKGTTQKDVNAQMGEEKFAKWFDERRTAKVRKTREFKHEEKKSLTAVISKNSEKFDESFVDTVDYDIVEFARLRNINLSGQPLLDYVKDTLKLEVEKTGKNSYTVYVPDMPVGAKCKSRRGVRTGTRLEETEQYHNPGDARGQFLDEIGAAGAGANDDEGDEAVTEGALAGKRKRFSGKLSSTTASSAGAGGERGGGEAANPTVIDGDFFVENSDDDGASAAGSVKTQRYFGSDGIGQSKLQQHPSNMPSPSPPPRKQNRLGAQV